MSTMGEPRTGAEVVWKQPIDSGPVPSEGETFDAIVVGGGPGGSAAAGYLAMEGKRVPVSYTHLRAHET